MSSDDFVYKPQDVDYLGFLEAQLRDMTGVATLAYELIQNADDVRDDDGRFTVTTLFFDVTDDALVVGNDGQFRAADFERLQSIAGGGKREEVGVTGAFGLGFLAVYQISDAPEIFSSGRHWIIRPDAPADQRIEERRTATSGTRFRLPWAFDPASPVRRALRLEVVGRDQLDAFARELSDAVARAAFFLRRLVRLEVRRNGMLLQQVERRRDGDRLQLTGGAAGDQSREWLLLDADFAAAAARLRQEFPWQIEERRRSAVQLAIPLDDRPVAGRLYAGLPTADTTPLAFHINADFFPTTDRKRIQFDEGYQAAWNQAAVTAAATLLPQKLAELRQELPPAGLLALLQSTDEAARRAAAGDLPPIFTVFWERLQPVLPQTPLFFTAAGAWLPPAEGRLLPRPNDAGAAATRDLLHTLQLPVLHPKLVPYAPLLRRMGAPTVTVDDVAAALHRVGLTRATPLAAAPPCLSSLDAWQYLWSLLEQLLRGLPPAARESGLAALRGCALALTDRLTLQPLSQVYRGRAEAQALFPTAAWLHPDLPADGFPGRYVSPFGVRQAVETLAAQPADALEAAWRQGQLDIPRLFRWLEAQQIEIFGDDPALIGEIRRLPLCPVQGELRPLAELFLPGGFDDPLQLAGLVDEAALGGRGQFLRDLGVAELDFDTYLHSHLPRVLATQPDLPSDGRHRLLQLLAARLGALRDDDELQAQLGRLPLIPCLDGSFRPATSVYAAREVLALLGPRVHVAEPVESAALQALYDWLGVRPAPSAADIVQTLLDAAKTWGAAPSDSETQTAVGNCWQALADQLQAGAMAADVLAPLQGQAVVPDGQNVLRAPAEMFLVDRPDLAARFDAWSAHLLPPDLPWRAAVLAAGVRPLSQVVTMTVVDESAAVAAGEVGQRIASRLPLLERLLRAESAAGRPVQADVLQNLIVLALPDLRVQARLPLGPQGVTAAAEPAAAKWIAGTLYLDGGRPVSWTAVARELAQALAPGRAAGGLALGIKEVLAAESAAAAGAVLDDLGYP